MYIVLSPYNVYRYISFLFFLISFYFFRISFYYSNYSIYNVYSNKKKTTGPSPGPRQACPGPRKRMFTLLSNNNNNNKKKTNVYTIVQHYCPENECLHYCPTNYHYCFLYNLFTYCIQHTYCMLHT